MIEAAKTVFARQGVDNTRIQEITEEADVGFGSFYNHFESKEALGAEIVERYGRDNPRRAALRDKSLPALARLRAHFARLNEAYTDARFGRGRYTVILTADHGGHGKSHGTTDPRDMTIPWIVWGAGVHSGDALSGIHTMDTAATVLWLLGTASGRQPSASSFRASRVASVLLPAPPSPVSTTACRSPARSAGRSCCCSRRRPRK